MPHQLRAFAALSGDQGSVPSIHIRSLTNLIPLAGNPKPSSGLGHLLKSGAHSYTQVHIHRHIK